METKRVMERLNPRIVVTRRFAAYTSNFSAFVANPYVVPPCVNFVAPPFSAPLVAVLHHAFFPAVAHVFEHMLAPTVLAAVQHHVISNFDSENDFFWQNCHACYKAAMDLDPNELMMQLHMLLLLLHHMCIAHGLLDHMGLPTPYIITHIVVVLKGVDPIDHARVSVHLSCQCTA